MRMLATVTATGYFAATASPYALTACPLHGGGPQGSSSHMDCAGMHMEHHPGDKTQQHSGHNCCCMGACCCTAMVSLPPGRLTALPVVPVAIAQAIGSTDLLPPTAAPDYRLPPPLGPPSLRV
jgi:hypothetical protein